MNLSPKISVDILSIKGWWLPYIFHSKNLKFDQFITFHFIIIFTIFIIFTITMYF